MKYTRKETWDIALGRTDKHEKVNFILPTLQWLKSKGCDELFYVSFSHYDLLLTKDWENGRDSKEIITFCFSRIVMSKINLDGVSKIVQERKEEDKFTNEDKEMWTYIKQMLNKGMS